MLAQRAPDASIGPDMAWEGSMQRCRRRHCPAVPAILIGALCACSSAQYRNTAHPDYGDAQHRTDVAQCRRDNSTVVTTQGYDLQTKVQVDEAKAEACMAALGWQTVSR
jgi:hypothetical protein